MIERAPSGSGPWLLLVAGLVIATALVFTPLTQMRANYVGEPLRVIALVRGTRQAWPPWLLLVALYAPCVVLACGALLPHPALLLRIGLAVFSVLCTAALALALALDHLSIGFAPGVSTSVVSPFGYLALAMQALVHVPLWR